MTQTEPALDLSSQTAGLLSGLTLAEQRAFTLVFLAQTGHGFDLGRPANRRIALRWWSEFLPSRVLIAARTCSTVGEFASALVRRLQGQIGGKGEVGFVHRQAYAKLANLPEEEQSAVLDVCERQSAALVTLVRAEIDEQRRKHGEKDKGAKGGSDAGTVTPATFGGTEELAKSELAGDDGLQL